MSQIVTSHYALLSGPTGIDQADASVAFRLRSRPRTFLRQANAFEQMRKCRVRRAFRRTQRENCLVR